MKKLILFLSLILAIILPVACDGPQASEDKYFSITFGGDFVDEFVMTVKENETAIMPIEPTFDGWEFLFWATETGERYDFELPVTEDLILHAVWQEQIEGIYHTVNFYGVNGQLIATQKVADGKSANSPVVSVSDFFVFDGWDKDFSAVTEDMDVHAGERYNGLDAELFTYSLNLDKTYTLMGVKSGAKLPQMAGGYIKLALPTTYNGRNITAIADGNINNGVYNGAFSRLKILSVYIPSCYKRIGAYAFYGNPTLSQVVFNEGLREIGRGAFMATFGEGNVHVGNFAHSGANAYISELTSVKIPSTVEVIEPYAFNHIGGTFVNNNYVVQEVAVDFGKESKLKEIGEYAFEGAMIRTLRFPDTKDRLFIGKYAFAADTYLNWVYTDSRSYPRSILTELSLSQSPLWKIDDYAFYGIGNMSTYYNGFCTTVASDIAFFSPKINFYYLGNYAFYGAQLTGTLNITAKDVGEKAFYGQKLSAITLSQTENIGAYAFGRKSGEVPFILDLGEHVRHIGDGAFINNVGLAKLALPDTLISIGANAFSGCTSMKCDIKFPKSTESIGAAAFKNSGIERAIILGSVSLGNQCFESSAVKEITGNIKSVGSRTFYECNLLTSVVLPQNMSTIPTELFAYCSSLKNIILPTSLSSIGNSAFSNCISLESIVLPVDLKIISSNAFESCSSLNDVTFQGDSVTLVGDSAFAMCQSLQNINLPDSVQTIQDYAFRGSGLTSFKTPESLENMGWRVFYQEEYIFTKLQKSYGLGLPESDKTSTVKMSFPALNTFEISSKTGLIKFCEQGTFDGSKITRFEVDEGNRAYSAVDGILYNANASELIMYIRDDSISKVDIVLPEGLVTINEGAFRDNPYLYNITLPSTLKTIEAYAFYNCSHLQSIALPQGLVSIGDYAFAGNADNMSVVSSISFADNSELVDIGEGAFSYNKSLKNISLPNSLVSIGDNAFYSASALTNIDFSKASSLEFIGELAFSGDSGLYPQIVSLDFTGCTSLSSTGRGAFVGCNSLKEINFADLTRVESGSFRDCTALTKVVIGAKIIQIGSNAFRGCTSLADIVIPKTNALRHIMSYAFAGTIVKNVNYSKVDLSNATDLELIDEYAFAYSKVTQVVLPDAPFELGDNAFAACPVLRQVDFGKGILTIGKNVFDGCVLLTELNLPASVEVIKKDAFRGLNLATVAIGTEEEGNSVTHLGENAFFDCRNLAIVNIYGNNVPYLADAKYNMSFHCTDEYGKVRIIPNLAILIDFNMKAAYVRSGSAANGWEVYKNVLIERVIIRVPDSDQLY